MRRLSNVLQRCPVAGPWLELRLMPPTEPAPPVLPPAPNPRLGGVSGGAGGCDQGALAGRWVGWRQGGCGCRWGGGLSVERANHGGRSQQSPSLARMRPSLPSISTHPRTHTHTHTHIHKHTHTHTHTHLHLHTGYPWTKHQQARTCTHTHRCLFVIVFLNTHTRALPQACWDSARAPPRRRCCLRTWRHRRGRGRRRRGRGRGRRSRSCGGSSAQCWCVARGRARDGGVVEGCWEVVMLVGGEEVRPRVGVGRSGGNTCVVADQGQNQARGPSLNACPNPTATDQHLINTGAPATPSPSPPPGCRLPTPRSGCCGAGAGGRAGRGRAGAVRERHLGLAGGAACGRGHKEKQHA